jgi:hypothetical protein
MARKKKPLMQVSEDTLDDLAGRSQTGMGFYIAASSAGWLIILEDGRAMPVSKHPNFFSLPDLLSGEAIPKPHPSAHQVTIQDTCDSRIEVLRNRVISPKFIGSPGAIPLVLQETLPVCTMFVRYISSPRDRRFNRATKTLKKDTYLTSQLDRHHADTGFGAVGRYALPLPIPISTVIEYTLPAGTRIEVGTVAPLFGQSGGGVEIKLVVDTKDVHQGFTYPLPPY